VLKGFFQNGITMLIKELVHRNILSLYFLLARTRDRSPNQSLVSTVYEKTTSETPQATANRITSASQRGIESAKSTLQDTKETVTNGVQNTVSTVTSTSQSGYLAAKDKVSNGYEVVKGSVQDNAEIAKTSISNIASKSGETLQGGYTTAKDSIQNSLEFTKDGISSAVSKSSKMLENGKNNINNVTNDARRSLANVIDPDTTPVAEPSVGDVSREVGGIEWNDKE